MTIKRALAMVLMPVETNPRKIYQRSISHQQNMKAEFMPLCATSARHKPCDADSDKPTTNALGAKMIS